VAVFSWWCFCGGVVVSGKRTRKVLSRRALSFNIVIKHCPEFSSAEVVAVFKDCHQRLPKVLLK